MFACNPGGLGRPRASREPPMPPSLQSRPHIFPQPVPVMPRGGTTAVHTCGASQHDSLLAVCPAARSGWADTTSTVLLWTSASCWRPRARPEPAAALSAAWRGWLSAGLGVSGGDRGVLPRLPSSGLGRKVGWGPWAGCDASPRFCDPVNELGTRPLSPGVQPWRGSGQRRNLGRGLLAPPQDPYFRV